MSIINPNHLLNIALPNHKRQTEANQYTNQTSKQIQEANTVHEKICLGD